MEGHVNAEAEERQWKVMERQWKVEERPINGTEIGQGNAAEGRGKAVARSVKGGGRSVKGSGKASERRRKVEERRWKISHVKALVAPQPSLRLAGDLAGRAAFAAGVGGVKEMPNPCLTCLHVISFVAHLPGWAELWWSRCGGVGCSRAARQRRCLSHEEAQGKGGVFRGEVGMGKRSPL